MSTRSQILVEGSNVILYRHNDGYPDGPHGVLATLCPLVKEFVAYRGHEEDYMSAQILYAIMNPHKESYSKVNTNAGLLGYGIEAYSGYLHGDIEYIYVVKKDGHIEVRKLGVTYQFSKTVLAYCVNFDGERMN